MREHEDRRTWPLPFGERAELTFRSDFCAAEVVPVRDGEQPFIEVRGRDAGRLHVEVGRDGDAVRIEVDRRGVWPGMLHGRDGRVTLHVPRGLRAEMKTDIGSIRVRDLGACDLDLRTDAGRIEVDDLSGRLRLSTDAGQIRGRGLAGRFDVQTAAGSIRLGITGLEPGEHSFRTDAGSIRLSLAPGLDVRVEAHAGLGTVKASYPSREDAAAVLRAATDVGLVKIREGGRDDSDDEERGWAGGFGPELRRRFEVEFERGFGHGPPRPPAPFAPPAPPPPPPSAFGEEEREVFRTGPSAPAGAEAPPRAARPVDAEVERILKLVESGELSARDADELLRALERE